MAELQKVIEGLEYCMGGCQVSCFNCPYRGIGQPSPDSLDNCGILNDAVELLKEQKEKLKHEYMRGYEKAWDEIGRQ